MSRATTSEPVSITRVRTGYCDKRVADLVHRLIEVDRDRRTAFELVLGDVGEVLRGIGLELLEEDTVGGDLAERLPVGRTRHRQRDRARRAVAREADDTHVVTEVLAAELRADTELLREGEDLLLELDVPKAAAEVVAVAWERVEVARRCELGGLQRELGGGSADDEREVVRRARGRTERAQLLVEPAHQRLRD